MSENFPRTRFANYGATSEDPEVMFAGESREMKTLCDNIGTNVYTINSGCKTLQNVLVLLGTERDTQGVRDQAHVCQLSVNQVVKVTTGDITRLSTVSRGANKVQRLQADKLTNHFKEAVNEYSQIQIAVAEKLRSSLPRQLSYGDNDESSLLEDEERHQLQLQQELQLENDLLLEREQRVQHIESDILDVNQIMRQLAALVNEQATHVDTIESSIEHARGDVEAGRSELQSAANYQNKTRKRYLCLFGTFIVVLIILISIIAWSSR